MNRRMVRAAILALATLLLAGCVSAAGQPVWTEAARPQSETGTPTQAPAGAAMPGMSMMPGMSAGSAAPQVAAGGTSQVAAGGTIEIHAVDLGFNPTNVTVPAAGTYAVRFVNDGAITHNVTFPDGTAISANAGQSADGKVSVPATGISFLCSVPGHADAGMRGTIVVAGAGAAAGASAGGDHGGPAPVTTTAADPNAPAYEPYDATAPAVLPGSVHDITLTTIEKKMTVAPGYVVGVWTFNGTVPGPVIRVHLGDTVRIHLVNPAGNQMPHSIDFHASQVAWNGPMTSINPGQDATYIWHADYAGVWMYHCGTAPALHHIANGMYGMVIVEPKGGLPKVDREYAIVQSEWYLGPQGQPVDLTKAAAANPAPDFVVFNGVASQYKDHPLPVNPGKTVRIFLLDAGPNVDSSFHIVGTIFNTVIKEGVQLVRSNEGGWGSQAVDLSPAQGAIIELVPPEDGLYPIVTHAFNFVGRGALGLLQAGDGKFKGTSQH